MFAQSSKESLRALQRESEQAACEDEPVAVRDDPRGDPSQGSRTWVAVRSVTVTGPPPRLRSRARKGWPDRMSLTS